MYRISLAVHDYCSRDCTGAYWRIGYHIKYVVCPPPVVRSKIHDNELGLSLMEHYIRKI